jgi:hypothetical protein
MKTRRGCAANFETTGGGFRRRGRQFREEFELASEIMRPVKEAPFARRNLSVAKGGRSELPDNGAARNGNDHRFCRARVRLFRKPVLAVEQL